MSIRRSFCTGLIALSIFSCSCTRARRSAAVSPPPHAAADAEHEDNPFEAAEYFRQNRVPGEELLPVERYDAAMRHASTMRRYSLRQGAYVDVAARAPSPFGSWESLGPGNVGGRTRGLVVHPQNPQIMWAGGATGGIWKTIDGGQSWHPVSDFAPVLAINCLVMEPGNPNTLYACTGEQTQNWRGAGIYKTTDGGSTWSQLAATDTPDFYFVNNIAISPAAPSHLYAATNTGLWISLDSGNTWSLSLASRDGGPAATRTGGTTYGCYDTIVQPGQSNDVVFAVCHEATGSTNPPYSVFRNPNAAGTGGWSVVLSDPNMWYTVLAAAPSQPGTIYAVSVTLAGSSSPYYRALLAVYRSTSGGLSGTWQVRDSNQSTNLLNSAILSIDSAYNFNGSFCGTSQINTINLTGQAGYNLAVAVDPLDANRLWVAGVGLFRSDDGGANWGWAESNSHHDHHGFAFHPGYNGATNQILYEVNDGGIYQTTQARGPVGTCANRNTTVNWTSLNNSYSTTQFYHGVAYPGGGAYFGGTQDNGTVRGTDTGGPNQWTSIYDGDGGVSRLDPLDANTLYVEYVLGAFAKSLDGGFTYSKAVTGITESSNNFPFIAWYTFDPNNSLRLFTGGRQLWHTENGMASWSAASAPTDLVAGDIDNIRAISVSPADANLVLFGTHYGKIFRNVRALEATGSTVWNFTAPRTGNIAHLEFDPNQPNVVYATYTTFNSAPGDNHIYRSTDSGVTWIGIDGAGPTGLPDVPVETILVDPADSTRLYVGSDVGVFASIDGGATWVRDDNPFANVIVTTLSIDAHQGPRYLYAFTYGRGVWRVPLPNGPGAGTSPCIYSASPTSITADPIGGEYAVEVSTGPNCAWSARTASSATSPSVLRVIVEPPGSGIGSGKAYLSISSTNMVSARSNTILIQNQPVNVTQPPAAVSLLGDEIASAYTVPALPYQTAALSAALTENAKTDPRHSCTGSTNLKTGWYTFTASANGYVQASGSVYSGGVVVTAYPAGSVSASAELGCATVAPSLLNPTASITFAVSAGNQYVVEVAQLQSAATNTSFSISMAAPPVTFDISPPEAVLWPGQTKKFQTVTSNLGNSAVRWLLAPQFGVITPDGTFTVPAQLGAPSQLTLTGQSLANTSLLARSTITVESPPAFTLGTAAVTNAASYQTGAVAPGEVVTIFGTSIGPANLLTAQLNAAGNLASTINGTRVLFDNIPAPLVYVAANQVSAIVPYEVAGQPTTQMVVERNGQATQTLTVPVTAVLPALFTVGATGTGQAAAVNQDTTLNGPASGAPVGSVVAFFGTGEGQSSPGGINGRVANTIYPAPLAKVTATIGNLEAEVRYAGAAPQATAGLLQVNLKVPALPPGTYPVVVTIGGVPSQAGVTLTVR